ncbi:MAG: hypothetical protein Roseis2KO_59590 [Roseivirga sp.]
MKNSKLTLHWEEPESYQTHNQNWPKGYFEYYVDDVALPDIIDQAYQYNYFIRQNHFTGTIYKSADPEFDTLNKALFLGKIKSVEDINDNFKNTAPPYLINDYLTKGQVPIYTCPCGDIICGGLVISIEVSSQSVQWNFGEREKLGPIYFEKNQYLTEIERAFTALV